MRSETLMQSMDITIEITNEAQPPIGFGVWYGLHLRVSALGKERDGGAVRIVGDNRVPDRTSASFECGSIGLWALPCLREGSGIDRRGVGGLGGAPNVIPAGIACGVARGLRRFRQRHGR